MLCLSALSPPLSLLPSPMCPPHTRVCLTVCALVCYMICVCVCVCVFVCLMLRVFVYMKAKTAVKTAAAQKGRKTVQDAKDSKAAGKGKGGKDQKK